MADETILIKVEVEGAQSYTALTKEVEKQSVSISKLREENKKLNKERNEVNINSEEGRAKLQSLNEKLDANNKKIKENVDSYAKQKIGIGDYKGALDKLVPGLGATANGFGGMTKQALTFLATPIGAVIGALGLALGALTAYFKGSEEGQDKLAKVMAVGKVIFESVMQVVEKLGKIVFDTLEYIATGFKSVIDFFSPTIGKMLDDAIKTGSQIADLQDSIDARENELIVTRAETNKKVAELRRKAIALEGDEKRKFIEQAIKLEEDLSKAETEQAANRLLLAKQDIATRGAATEEEKKQIAELTAAKFDAEAQASETTIRFQNELEKLNDEERARQAAIRARQAAIKEEEDAVKLRSMEFDREMFIQTEEIKRLEIDKTTDKQISSALKVGLAIQAQKIKEQQQTAKAEAEKTKITELENKLRLQTIGRTIGMSAELFEKDTMAYKFLAASRATIDTFAAVTEALPNIPLSIVVGALGLSNVAKILGVGFAEGGYTGDGGKHEIAGAVHRGEYVVPKHIVHNPVYAGYISTLESARRGYSDGGLVTNSATGQIEQHAAMTSAFRSAQFSVSWSEGYDMGRNIAFKEKMVSV